MSGPATSTRTWTLSVPDRERLVYAAFEAREHAYSPYSKFRVGAALLTTSGSIIKGCNVENASYGGTICAERTAIVKAVSEGARAFNAIAVVTDVSSTISPCGICRQVLREFCALNMPVLLVPADYELRTARGVPAGGILETSVGELLPHSFGPEQLELGR
ncbi:cytidine deaminase [Wolfiporia cocos MD-104 SS10]|uniref:Cytidine deaminase n=1 Tax=Wolfiporia cocos (strain MD-104) TaxID=742152 RepID=A0A2H3J482_WOLCO|nr:cytidine deaminase [Wolfiporia cocos MD-104 SS10]